MLNTLYGVCLWLTITLLNAIMIYVEGLYYSFI